MATYMNSITPHVLCADEQRAFPPICPISETCHTAQLSGLRVERNLSKEYEKTIKINDDLIVNSSHNCEGHTRTIKGRLQ